MGFKECAEKYRKDMLDAVERDDRVAGRESAIMYAVLMRQAAARIKSYVDRAVILRDADKYEYLAAVITKWGKSEEFYQAYKDPAPHTKLSAVNSSTKPVSTPTVGSSAGTAAPKAAAPAPASPSPKRGADDPMRSLGADKPRKTVSLVTPPAPGAASAPTAKPATAAPTVSPTAPPATAAAQPGVEWIADIMDKYINSVWIVRAGNSTATGFFITEDGYFLTNRHVVYNDDTPETSIYVLSHDEKKRYKARIQNVNKEFDVALLKVSGMQEAAKPIPILHDYSLVRAGGDMMIIGNGLDFGLAPITGTIKFPCAKHSGDLVYTAPTNNGDSGSPVLNRNGQLIGIHKSSTSAKIVGLTRIEAKGMSNATGASDILDLLSKWGLKI